MELCMAKLLEISPGGTLNPGGGPAAVEKPTGDMAVTPFIDIGPAALSGVEGFVPPGCPARTPRGFFEKLSRIPPLTLLCNWTP